VTTIAKVVVHKLLGVKISKTITFLVDFRIIRRAGLTHLLHTELEQVVVGLGAISAECLLKIRILVEVELDIKDIRASTTLLDTESLPVVQELAIIMVESLLKIRISVVIPISIKDHILRSDAGHGRNRKSVESHGGKKTLAFTLEAEVPGHLLGVEVSEPRISSLVNLRIESGAGLTELIHTILKEVVVSLGAISAESLLKIRILVEVELDIKDGRASTTLLDTESLPVIQELSLIMVESLLKIRVSVVIPLNIEDKIFNIDSTRTGDFRQIHYDLI